jgi:putative DNA primase/helicase
VQGSISEDERPIPPVELRLRPREKRDGLLAGKLVDHGRATYHHDPHAPMSYFVKLETSRGDRTIWGVDLERAFRESLTKPEISDEVGLRTVRQDPVNVRTQDRDDAGEITERKLETHRNSWIIEKRSFFKERAEAARTLRDTSVDPKQAVRAHPELVGTYLQVHAAELAAKQMRDPQDRALFVAKVRAALADGIARGEPLPAVRLRERATERASRTPNREAAPVRS